jgi:hypothetical protein
MTVRELILDWSKHNTMELGWMLKIYRHLIGNGVDPDEAIAELDRFVRDVILKKQGAA